MKLGARIEDMSLNNGCELQGEGEHSRLGGGSLV